MGVRLTRRADEIAGELVSVSEGIRPAGLSYLILATALGLLEQSPSIFSRGERTE
jgi:hypothetical protein